jgi:hypothetical protein
LAIADENEDSYYDSDTDNSSPPPPLVPNSADMYDSDSDIEEELLYEPNQADIGCVGKSMEKKDSIIGPDTWLEDCGVSCHLTNSDEGMFDVQIISSPIKIKNSK